MNSILATTKYTSFLLLVAMASTFSSILAHGPMNSTAWKAGSPHTTAPRFTAPITDTIFEVYQDQTESWAKGPGGEQEKHRSGPTLDNGTGAPDPR